VQSEPDSQNEERSTPPPQEEGTTLDLKGGVVETNQLAVRSAKKAGKTHGGREPKTKKTSALQFRGKMSKGIKTRIHLLAVNREGELHLSVSVIHS